MKIAIFTMFNGLNESYSLVSAVKNQIKMLLQNGHEVKVLVSEHCPDEERKDIFADSRLLWIKITNSINGNRAHWIDYTYYHKNVSPEFWILAKEVAKDLFFALQDTEICILHDILYQGLHLVHNAAVRTVQKKLPHLRFFAFTHSLPRENLQLQISFQYMYCSMPNTTFVCPSKAMVLPLARQYNIKEKDIAVIPTAIDITEGMSPEVKQIYSIRSFEKPEYIIIYPARAAASKGHNLLAQFAGELKRATGKHILIICCDSYGNAHSRRLIGFEMQTNGITHEEFLCTSELGFSDGLSHKAVLELFTLSNLFIFPSLAETQGLIALEAASRGNFLVMNSQAPALCQLSQSLWAQLYDFNTDISALPFKKEEAVKCIAEQISLNPVIQAKNAVRKCFSPNAIYNRYLAPLLD